MENAKSKRFKKLEILKLVESKVPYSVISKRYGISKGTVFNIWKIKDQLRGIQQQNGNLKKTIKFSEGGQIIDKIVYNWFCEARARNISVTGRILQEKALQVASIHNYENFTASNGWLEKFLRRHNISSKVLSGESADMNATVANDWKATLKDLCQGFEAKNIFNCDETGNICKILAHSGN